MKQRLSLLVPVLLLCGFMALTAPAAAGQTTLTICSNGGKLSVRAKCPRAATRVGRLTDLIGPQGPQGAAGPITGTLPAGVTLRGFYGTNGHAQPVGGNSVFHAPISFSFSLGSAPAAHYIAYNATPPAECPGNVGQPEAAPGHLCVYEDGRLNVSQATVATTAGENTAATFGAIVSVVASTTGMTSLQGTWAVTAP